MSLAGFFESYYRLRPVNATFTGVHEYDDRLPDWSPDGLTAAVDEMRQVRGELSDAGLKSCATSAVAQGFSPASSFEREGSMEREGFGRAYLTDVADRDRALAISFLDVQIAEHESVHFQRGNPSLALGEAVFGAIALMTRPFADITVRARSATARLVAVPAFLDGARKSIERIPTEWRLKACRECDGAERLLTSGIDRWIAVERVPTNMCEPLRDAARRALAAIAAFRRWLERDAPVADLKTEPHAAGGGLFDLLLARGHWCDRSRADLAAEARAALDEALARLDERSRQAAPGGWPEVQQRLADAHPTVDDYLASYRRRWDACRAHAEAHALVTWPDAPIRYVPIPVHTREAAPFLYYLFYRSPAPFDRLPIHDYVVTPIDGDLLVDEQERRLRATNLSVIALNHVVHHGAIGHHVQNAYAYAGASEIGRVAAVDCASRIGMFLGGTMAEGWACYATDVMDESGFFTPDEALAQQHTRARLLARAVVDIGLHERTLTFDDGVAIYRDRIGMSHEAARGEVCKNSMFPATAVMYWLGTDGIHRLRRQRERVEGASFQLRVFHDRLLAFGSIPVPLIARVWS